MSVDLYVIVFWITLQSLAWCGTEGSSCVTNSACAAHLLHIQRDRSTKQHYVTQDCEHTERQLKNVNPPSDGTSLNLPCFPSPQPLLRQNPNSPFSHVWFGSSVLFVIRGRTAWTFKWRFFRGPFQFRRMSSSKQIPSQMYFFLGLDNILKIYWYYNIRMLVGTWWLLWQNIWVYCNIIINVLGICQSKSLQLVAQVFIPTSA